VRAPARQGWAYLEGLDCLFVRQLRHAPLDPVKLCVNQEGGGSCQLRGSYLCLATPELEHRDARRNTHLFGGPILEIAPTLDQVPDLIEGLRFRLVG